MTGEMAFGTRSSYYAPIIDVMEIDCLIQTTKRSSMFTCNLVEQSKPVWVLRYSFSVTIVISLLDIDYIIHGIES
jgi:hypothetical protein